MAEYKEEKSPSTYVPSQKETEVVNRVFERFTRMKDERDKPRREFDGLTITEYVNNSMDAYNGIVSEELKATKEDWQSITWDHKTRGKVKATISMIVGMRPFISIVGKKDEWDKYAADINDAYEDSWKNENGAYKLYLQAMSAVNKGTVIVEEIYDEEKIKLKEIISVNHETGQIKYTEKEAIRGGMGHCKTNIVNLLRFYPNENSSEIEHDCCVVEFYTEAKFRAKFGKYKNSEYVKPGNYITGVSEDDIKYKSISTTRNNDLIEVLRYYNEDVDEFDILANGFWINRQLELNGKEEKEGCSPIPFNHKRLPFRKTVFELADEDCFHGKSLPDLMKGEQDTDNALLRLMIDQEILALNKPVILGSGIDIESFELFPGKPMKVNGPIDQVREMQMTGATQSGFQLLNLLKNNSDTNTAIDPISQGVAGGGRKTAREAVILDENSKKNAGPFQLHIYKLLLDRAVLRVENIKQFYTQPIQSNTLKDKKGKPILKNGKELKTGKKYRTITVDKPGKKTRWFDIDPKMSGADVKVRFVEDFEVSDSRSLRLENAEAVLAESKNNPLLNADEATIMWLEARRTNPDKLYIKPKKQDMDFVKNQGLPPQNPMPQPQ